MRSDISPCRYHRASGDFTIETANYTTNIQSGACDIDHASQKVYFLADTTLDGYVPGRRYRALFTITIEGMPKVIMGDVRFYVK